MTERIQQVEDDQLSEKTKHIFDTTQRKINMVPNLYRILAQSPQALDGYLALNGALAQGSLSPKLREQLAISVATENGCEYCLAAHTAIGKISGLSGEELEAAQAGHSKDAKTAAALRFAGQVLAKRGEVSDAELKAVRTAGFNDGHIVEIVAHIALNTLTNFVNNVAKTRLDFPKVAVCERQVACGGTH